VIFCLDTAISLTYAISLNMDTDKVVAPPPLLRGAVGDRYVTHWSRNGINFLGADLAQMHVSGKYKRV
jgi:hypothetical protein